MFLIVNRARKNLGSKKAGQATFNHVLGSNSSQYSIRQIWQVLWTWVAACNDIQLQSIHFLTSLLLVEPKKRNAQNKLFTLQNGNICKQDSENLSLSLPIILSLEIKSSTKNDPIFCKKCVKVLFHRRTDVKLIDWQSQLQCSVLPWNVFWQIFENLRTQTFWCVPLFNGSPNKY